MRVPASLLRSALGFLVGLGIAWLLFAPMHVESQGLPGQVQPRRIVTIADVTINGNNQLDAADENRMFLNCTNNDAVNDFRIGDGTPGGQLIGPGATITIAGTYQVIGVKDTANVVVSCTKELRT